MRRVVLRDGLLNVPIVGRYRHAAVRMIASSAAFCHIPLVLIYISLQALQFFSAVLEIRVYVDAVWADSFAYFGIFLIDMACFDWEWLHAVRQSGTSR